MCVEGGCVVYVEDCCYLDVGGLWGVEVWGGGFFVGYELFGLFFVVGVCEKELFVVVGGYLYVCGF